MDTLVSPNFCQIRDDLLNSWSDTAKALSDAVLKRSDLPELEKARRDVQNAQTAFDKHAREHGCRSAYPIVK